MNSTTGRGQTTAPISDNRQPDGEPKSKQPAGALTDPSLSPLRLLVLADNTASFFKMAPQNEPDTPYSLQ